MPNRTIPQSAVRIVLMSVVLVAHAIGLFLLTVHTRVEPVLSGLDRLDVVVELEAQLPSLPPPALGASQAPVAAAVAPVQPVRTNVPAMMDAEQAPPSQSSLTALRLADQMQKAAGEVAMKGEQSPPFAGRSIDGMLPDGGPGLPGFRPQTRSDERDSVRKFLSMLERGLPQAAGDYDAPLDLLTEGWEQAHHGSDLAACMRQYQRFEEDLQRQLCGDVRPP